MMHTYFQGCSVVEDGCVVQEEDVRMRMMMHTYLPESVGILPPTSNLQGCDPMKDQGTGNDGDVRHARSQACTTAREGAVGASLDATWKHTP